MALEFGILGPLEVARDGGPLAIGAKRDNNRYFRGSLDELWVVGRALSDVEIAALYATNILIPEPTAMLLSLMGGLACGVFVRKRK